MYIRNIEMLQVKVVEAEQTIFIVSLFFDLKWTFETLILMIFIQLLLMDCWFNLFVKLLYTSIDKYTHL